MLFLGPDCKVSTDKGECYGMEKHGFQKGKAQYLPGNGYYMEEALFAQVLDTIMKNLQRAGFKIVMAHGHGPSTDTFRAHKEEYFEKYGLNAYSLWDLGMEGEEGIQTDHAGTNETSITMAVAPELVNIQNLDPDAIPVSVFGKDPRVFASRELGESIIHKNVSVIGPKLCKLVNALREEVKWPEFHDLKSLIGLSEITDGD